MHSSPPPEIFSSEPLVPPSNQPSEILRQKHAAFLAQQKTFAFYRTHGLRMAAFPGIFHPAPGSSSLFLLDVILAHSLVINRDPKPHILDIGCGSGIVGLGLHRYAQTLYLTDIALSAVRCTKLNAWINGIKAICTQSDLFSNIPQRQFDLITFNIPLLQQPISDPVEQTTNDPGGQLFQRFIQDLTQFLSPQGEAYLAYSTLGDMQLLEQIPEIFEVTRLATEAFPEIATERYVFRLTWR